MAKILEKIVEPYKIEIGSNFLLKVKILKEKAKLGDLKKLKCSKIKNFKVICLKEK